MKLILTEEQQFLKDTAQSFARDKTPVTHFRELRDSDNANAGIMLFGKKWLI
jgi:hypothetical protein